MRPAKVGAEAVGDALIAAFRAGGYAGASLRDLGHASGLKSASLYHRFPRGKADMAQAALGRAGEAFGAAVLAPLTAAGDPAARLATSAAGVAEFYQGGALACLLAVMALSDAPEPVRATVRAMFAQWTNDLAGALADCGVPDPHSVAEDRIAALQGALILAQSGAGPEAFARAVTRLARP